MTERLGFLDPEDAAPMTLVVERLNRNGAHYRHAKAEDVVLALKAAPEEVRERVAREAFPRLADVHVLHQIAGSSGGFFPDVLRALVAERDDVKSRLERVVAERDAAILERDRLLREREATHEAAEKAIEEARVRVAAAEKDRDWYRDMAELSGILKVEKMAGRRSDETVVGAVERLTKERDDIESARDVATSELALSREELRSIRAAVDACADESTIDAVHCELRSARAEVERLTKEREQSQASWLHGPSSAERGVIEAARVYAAAVEQVAEQWERNEPTSDAASACEMMQRKHQAEGIAAGFEAALMRAVRALGGQAEATPAPDPGLAPGSRWDGDAVVESNGTIVRMSGPSNLRISYQGMLDAHLSNVRAVIARHDRKAGK